MARKLTPKNFAIAMRSWRQRIDEREETWAELEAFADAGVNPFAELPRTPCAMSEAISSGSLEAVKLAARAAGDRFAKGINGRYRGYFAPELREPQALLCDAWEGSSAEGRGGADMAELLVSLGANPEGNTMNLGAPLAAAVLMNDMGMARALVAAGADPLRRRPGGRTLIHVCVQRSDSTQAMFLLLESLGVDPHAVDDQGATAFDMADPAQASWLLAWKERKALDTSSGPSGAAAAAPPRL